MRTDGALHASAAVIPEAVPPGGTSALRGGWVARPPPGGWEGLATRASALARNVGTEEGTRKTLCCTFRSFVAYPSQLTRARTPPRVSGGPRAS